MSDSESDVHEADSSARLPTFDLSWDVDDTQDPSTITVFSRDGDPTETWLSVDVGHAVPIEEIA